MSTLDRMRKELSELTSKEQTTAQSKPSQPVDIRAITLDDYRNLAKYPVTEDERHKYKSCGDMGDVSLSQFVRAMRTFDHVFANTVADSNAQHV